MISLIHPSRGRAYKSFDTTRRWLNRSGCETELIVSIDSNDPQKQIYESLYSQSECKLIINNNDCVVEAANIAAKQSSGEILIYVSDDFDCPSIWCQEIISISQHFGPEWLLKVDDCLQRFEADVLTIPIMSKKLYERLGYFFHPAYRSMFCDQDLYYTVINLGVLKHAKHLRFPHEHYCNGKAKIDSTYERSDKNWDSGKALYAERQRQNFPL